MKKLMVLDGNAIVNRAFYGVRGLTTKEGLPTNAVFGFLNILQKLLNEDDPDALCVAFDLRAPTFRHEQYEGYKAQRKPMPDDLAAQMPILREALEAMNIPSYELEGYEADDVIGDISRVCEENGWECVIVTGDKDSLQLVSDKTTVKLVSTRGGQTVTRDITPESFADEYKFPPKNIIDLKALMGDSSDNIPGVPGVGEKTAMDLIQRFGTVEGIYTNLDTLDIKESVKKRLSAGADSAKMSYELATICCDLPIDFDPENNIRREINAPVLFELFKKLEFRSFIEKFRLWEQPAAEEKKELPEATVNTVYSGEELSDLARRCKEAEYIAVHCFDDLDGVEICESGGQVSEVLWSNLGEAYNPFLRVIFSPDVKKAAHNVKDIMRTLMTEGLSTEGFIFDTALAAYLIHPTDNGYTTDKLSESYFGGALPSSAAVYSLYPLLASRLEKLGMAELYSSIEMPLCEVLADMEHEGFHVDREALQEFGAVLSDRIDGLQADIYELAGEEFNINSPKQLGVILFEKLKLPAYKKTKTGYSTNIEVLEKLRGKHEIIEKIIDFRGLAKLKSTYVDGLVKVIRADGRIHTNFQMTVTATGRLSSTEPNLQNIPIRRELGGEIRKMFVAESGKILVDADYSQIELRILAHISEDEGLIRAFLSGEDVHTVTASQVFGILPEEVTPTERSRAKAVNFGIVYGISDFSLAQDIGVSRAEARFYMDSYLSRYHGVRSYMTDIVERAKKEGHVTTLFGRRRDLPELKSSNFNIRSFGERVALNTPIQGTAADIIKLAMVNVYRRLKEEGLKAKLILQVHDELIVEAPEDEEERVKTILTEEMESVISLSAPLVAEAHSGMNWYDAK